MLVIFDMLMSLFERAFLVAYQDDYMREWCRREDFANALPALLSGEDPEFQACLEKVAAAEKLNARRAI